MKRKFLVGLTVLLVITLLGFQIVVSHRLSTVGADLQAMDEEIGDLTLENELLQREIATSSSLMTISKKATELGFVSPAFLYLEKPPVALVE